MACRTLAVSLWLLAACTCLGQNFLEASYTVYGKSYTYHRTKADNGLKGILLLFPGKGEKPKDVFGRTSLPSILAAKGFVTIVPDLQYSLFVNDLIKAQLQEILRIQSTPGRSEKLMLALGGFSAGGSIAVSYAEYLISQDAASNLACVFAIDPPVDLERLYKTSEWLMKHGCVGQIRNEARQTALYLHDALEGSPVVFTDKYVSLSPFLASKPDGGNAKWLRKLPVRLYSEPDIDFVRKKHCEEIDRADLNITDLENLFKLLKESGNDKAELIITEKKGYHSWNIIDPAELADWIAAHGN